MKTLSYLTLVLFGSILLTGCDSGEIIECPPTTSDSALKITVQPVFGADDLYLDSTYTTAEGYLVQFTDLKFYFGSPRNGNNTMLDAGLFDFRERGTTLLEATGAPSDYSSLDAYLGIDSVDNHSDPVGFPTDSWLYISNSNDMYWGWNPGFIFVKVEAKADTLIDATELFNHNVVFHIGADVNRQDLSFTNINWTNQGNAYVFPLKLDMQQFLQNGASTIDLKTEHSSHTSAGQEALSLKVITNFKDALNPI